MRIYLYVTTSFMTTSTYLQDGISIQTDGAGEETSMLNFLGKDIVDATINTQNYAQMQPTPADGSMPLASRKWYMLQYEMAYDPNISQIPYAQMQLNWYLNYCNVDSIKMGGEVQGKLNGTIGAASSSSSKFFDGLTSVGKTAGTGALAIIGKDFLTNNTTNETTGDNTLGLSNGVFKQLVNGVNSAISSAANGLPSAAVSLLSAIIGGSSSSPTTINLNLKANITMYGSQASTGAISSTPTSFWIPGTNISTTTVGYIPAYNKPLGVINFNGKPQITINVESQYHEMQSDEYGYSDEIYRWTDYTAVFPSDIDFSDYLIINPAVLQVANVTIESQDLVYTGDGLYGRDACSKVSGYFTAINLEQDFWREGYAPYYPGGHGSPIFQPYDVKIGVRFTVKITPHNGAPASLLIKTFLLDHQWNYYEISNNIMKCY